MGKWIAGLVAAIVLAGAGVYAYQTVWDRAPDDVAIGLTPKDAGMFASVYVNPANDQKRAIDSLLKKFPQTESFEDTKNLLVDLLDPELEPVGINFEDDIEPWLGDQIGLFFMGTSPGQVEPDAAVMIATKDQDATQEMIDKILESEAGSDTKVEERSYKGVDYNLDPDPAEGELTFAFGFVENYLVGGSEVALKAAIDASQGESLEDSEKYQAAVSPFYEDRIALLYIDGSVFIDAAREAAGTLPPEQEANLDLIEEQGFLTPQAVALRADENGVMFETSSVVGEEGIIADITRTFGESGLIRDLPGGAWAAFGVPQIGGISESVFGVIEDIGGGDALADAETNVEFETGLDLREDILSWMGDAALFVQGTDLQSLGGGLLVESSDPAKTDAAVDAIAEYVNGFEPGLLEPIERDGRSGYSAQPFGFPVPVNILGGESLIVAVGEKATNDMLSGESTLGSTERFQEVDALLGSDLNPIFFVDIKQATTLYETFLAQSPEDQDGYQTEVKPILQHFTYAVLGVKIEDDVALQRFVVGIE